MAQPFMERITTQIPCSWSYLPIHRLQCSCLPERHREFSRSIQFPTTSSKGRKPPYSRSTPTRTTRLAHQARSQCLFSTVIRRLCPAPTLFFLHTAHTLL